MPAAPADPADPAASDGSSAGVSVTTLRLAVAVLGVEAAGLLVIVVLLALDVFTAASVSTGSALGTTGFAALVAALLGGLGWALWRRHGWARGPAIVLELLLLPIGYSMATNGLSWVGVVVMLIGLVGATALLAPSTRAALELG
jgi:hypothetical protein